MSLTITGLANNTISGSNGADGALNGAPTSHDTIDGLNGDDVMSGLAGNDKLFGGDGADMLDGGRGDDLLDGGRGDDILTGGLGADTFVFGSFNTGSDTITDFKIGPDRIRLEAGVTITGKALKTIDGGGVLDAQLALSNGGTVNVLDVDLASPSVSGWLTS